MVGSEAASWGTADGVSGIELHVEWIESVAARADRDPNGIRVWVDLVFTIPGLIKLEADLGQVVQFGNGTAGNLGLDAAL